MTDVFQHAHNIALERAILGTVLDGRKPDALAILREVCPAREYFYESRHQMIYATCMVMADAGETVTQATVTLAMTRVSYSEFQNRQKGKPIVLRDRVDPADTLLKAVGIDTIGGMVGEAADFGGFRRTCENLRAYYHQRVAMTSLRTALEAVSRPEGSTKVPEIGSSTIAALSAICGQQEGTASMSEAMARALVHHDTMAAAKHDTRAASWGITDLDRIIPLKPGRFIILAAQPNHGKTSLALQAATASAELMGHGSVGVISLETDAEEIGRLLLGRALHINASAIEAGNLDQFRREKADDVVRAWGQTDVYLRSSHGQSTMEDIASWIRQRHLRSGGRLALVILDYLQLIDATGRQHELEKLSAATRALKRLALDLRICLLVLSQMNREGTKAERDRYGNVKGNPEPRIQDLRGSGTIEQDADGVVFIWPPNEVAGHAPLPVLLKVAKNRGGPKPEPIEAYFDRADGQRFRSAVEPDPAHAAKSQAMYAGAPQPAEDQFAYDPPQQEPLT